MATKFKLPQLTTSLGQPRHSVGINSVYKEPLAPQTTTQVHHHHSIQEDIEMNKAVNAPVPKLSEQEIYLKNAKLVVAYLISVKMLGNDAARDYFKAYCTYVVAAIKGEESIRDYLSFTYKDNAKGLKDVVSLLNKEEASPLLTLAPLKLSAIQTDDKLSSDVDLTNFCSRHRMPVLATSTKDLILFGIINPSFSTAMRAFVKEECSSIANAKIDFLLITEADMCEIFRSNVSS